MPDPTSERRQIKVGSKTLYVISTPTSNMQFLKVNIIILFFVAILVPARVHACMTADIQYDNSGWICGELEDVHRYMVYHCWINVKKNGFDIADDRRGYKAAKMKCDPQYDEDGNTYGTYAWITLHTAPNTDVQDKFAIIYESLGRRMHFGLEWHDHKMLLLPYRLTAMVWCE